MRTKVLLKAMISPIIAIALVMPILLSKTVLEASASPLPPDDEAVSSLGNVVIIVAVAFSLLILMYYLVSRGRWHAVAALRRMALGIAVLSASMLYLSLAVGLDVQLSIAASAVMTALIVFAIERGGERTYLAVSLTSALVASALMLALPLYVITVLLIWFVVYDLLVVYVGPLSKILSKLRGQGEKGFDMLRGLVVRLDGVVLGTGDLIIYSLTVLWSLSLFYLRTSSVLGSALLTSPVFIAIAVGLTATARVLAGRRGYAPAIPIPVLLSVAYTLLAYQVLSL